MRDILETASECLHKKNHGVWKQTRNVSDFNRLHVFFFLSLLDKNCISQSHKELKKLKKLFEFLSVNFCIGGNFLRGVATPPPTQPISSYSPRAKSPRGLTPSGSTLSFTRIADTKHKCEQFYIFILLSIGYD